MENPIKNGWCGGKPAFLGSPPYGGVINPTLTSRDSSTAGSSSKAASCAKTLWRGTGRFQSPWGHAYMILCVFFWRIGTYAYNFCKCSTVHPILAIWFIYLLTSLTKLPSRWENSRLPGTGFGRKTRSATSFNLTGKSSTCWTKCSLDFCDQWKGFKEHLLHISIRWLSHIIYVALKGCIF